MPSLNRRDLTRLAQVGALNQLGGIQHRRDALWQVERAGKLEGPLLRDNESLREDSDARPLQQMNVEERLVANYAGTGLTVGKHPMHYRRHELRRNNILSAEKLRTRQAASRALERSNTVPEIPSPCEFREHRSGERRRGRGRAALL